MVIQATYQCNVPIWKVPAIHSKDSSGSIFARKRTFQDISEDLNFLLAVSVNTALEPPGSSTRISHSFVVTILTCRSAGDARDIRPALHIHLNCPSHVTRDAAPMSISTYINSMIPLSFDSQLIPSGTAHPAPFATVSRSVTPRARVNRTHEP